MDALLVGLGIAIAAVAAFALADEWRSAAHRRRQQGGGMRFEVVLVGAIVLGLGIGVAYGGFNG